MTEQYQPPRCKTLKKLYESMCKYRHLPTILPTKFHKLLKISVSCSPVGNTNVFDKDMTITDKYNLVLVFSSV